MQRYGGISRYFFELIKSFNNEQKIHVLLSLVFSNNYYIEDNKFFSYVRFFPNFQFKGKQRLLNPLNKYFTYNKISKQEFDIFHPTYYDVGFLEYLSEKPFVLTVHDMIHEKFSNMLNEIGVDSESKEIGTDVVENDDYYSRYFAQTPRMVTNKGCLDIKNSNIDVVQIIQKG